MQDEEADLIKIAHKKTTYTHRSFVPIQHFLLGEKVKALGEPHLT